MQSAEQQPVTLSPIDLVRELIEFFNEALAEDPAGVGDWLAQGELDADAFINALPSLLSKLTEAA